MTFRARKRRAATKNGASATVKKRLPAYKRQPDLYYSHVWLDREIYSQVLAFIGWERQRKYSIKMAVRILLELGLKYYVSDQINMAKNAQHQAEVEGQAPPEPTDFIKAMRKRSHKMGLPSIV